MTSSESSMGNRKSLGNQEMELNKKSRNQKIEEKDKWKFWIQRHFHVKSTPWNRDEQWYNWLLVIKDTLTLMSRNMQKPFENKKKVAQKSISFWHSEQIGKFTCKTLTRSLKERGLWQQKSFTTCTAKCSITRIMTPSDVQRIIFKDWLSFLQTWGSVELPFSSRSCCCNCYFSSAVKTCLTPSTGS